MTISYPLTLPAPFRMAAVTFRQRSVSGGSPSPFTGEEQIYEHPGQWWEAEVTLPRMARADAQAVLAAFWSLRGRAGYFLMGDPVGIAPLGSGGGTPVVDGAGQSGLTLALRGLPVSTAGWLKAFDWIQIGSGSTARLHKVLTDITTSAAGKATLDIWPRLRYAPADGAAITLANTVGLWRLSSGTQDFDIAPAMRYGYAFACREKLP